MQIQNNFLNTYIVDVPKPMFSSDFPCLLNNCVQLKMENEYTLILSRICNIQNNFLNTYIVDVFKPLFSSDFPGLFNKCVQLKWNYKKINQFKH